MLMNLVLIVTTVNFTSQLFKLIAKQKKHMEQQVRYLRFNDGLYWREQEEIYMLNQLTAFVM